MTVLLVPVVRRDLPGACVIEQVEFGGRPQRAGSGRMEVAVGDDVTIGLGVSATSPTELDGATASVWTNAGTDDPGVFREVPMTAVVPTDHHQRAFEITLPALPTGTYVVTAFVAVGGQRFWASTRGLTPDLSVWDRNLVFRVREPWIDRLYVRQVPVDKVNAGASSTDISTLDDMLGDQPGKYSLALLARQGVNCVWVQVPYRLDLWPGLDRADDAGSDYASNDWFAIDPQLSLEARAVPAWDLDLQRERANDVMRRFVHEAHDRDMRVVFDIAPHHVGHNFIFRDEFPTQGGTEVRRRDYSQTAVNAAQLAEVQARLASPEIDETIKNYAEWMLPQMYATRWPDGTYNPFGASSVDETYSPWWYGNWSDTKHLNHGGDSHERKWVPSTEQNWKVLGYIGRAMRWAVLDLGIDGFRIDHSYGMPFAFLEQTVPRVEKEVRAAGRGPVLLIHEDHNRKRYTAGAGDVVQANGYFRLLEAFARRDPAAVRSYYDDPDTNIEFVGTGNHDERRGSTFFRGDLIGYGNAVMSMLLWGGSVTTLAGDEFAEGEQLRFKALGGVPTLLQLRLGTLPGANVELEYWIGRAARLRNHPAFSGTGREDLTVRDGAAFLAAARFGRDAAQAPVLVVNNLGADGWTQRMCEVGQRIGAWLEPAAHYQIVDLVGLDPTRPLWRHAIAGADLAAGGISIGLQPRQIQALELLRV